MRFSVSALLPLCRRLATLKQNRDAAVLIEYALVAPPFLALLIAILNTAMIYVAQEGLETAAESAARIMMTGQAQTMTLANGHVGMTAADFKSAICSGFTGTDSSGNSVTYAAMLPPMLSCANLTVNVQTATAYNVSNIAAQAQAGTHTGRGAHHACPTEECIGPGAAGCQGRAAVLE